MTSVNSVIKNLIVGYPIIVLYKMTPYHIKEKSWIAKLAAIKLSAGSVAIVIGKTIHLHKTNREDFLANERWLKHELCHLKQFKEHGFFPFIYKYLLESIKRGYRNNKYEIEAREAEKDLSHEEAKPQSLTKNN